MLQNVLDPPYAKKSSMGHNSSLKRKFSYQTSSHLQDKDYLRTLIQRTLRSLEYYQCRESGKYPCLGS